MKTNFEETVNARNGINPEANEMFSSIEPYFTETQFEDVLNASNEYVAGEIACESMNCVDCMCSACCPEGKHNGWERFFLADAGVLPESIGKSEDCWPIDTMESLGFTQSDFI